MATNKKIIENSVKSLQFTSKIKNYFFIPIKMGFLSFAVLFSIIVFVKLISFLGASDSVFTIGIYDIMISIIGFCLGFLLELALQFRKKNNIVK